MPGPEKTDAEVTSSEHQASGRWPAFFEEVDHSIDQKYDDRREGYLILKEFAEQRIAQYAASRHAPTDEGARPDSGEGTPMHPPISQPQHRPALLQERATYEAHKTELLKDEGKFVLIRGGEIAGIWPSFEAALEAGYERFGPVAFMVKLITAVEPVYPVSRDVLPCPM
jgi:hypothetical protein